VDFQSSAPGAEPTSFKLVVVQLPG